MPSTNSVGFLGLAKVSHPRTHFAVTRYCPLRSSFPVGHTSWDCSSINMLNLGVPIPSEAAEPPKGLVLDWRSSFPVGHPSWDCYSINMLNLEVPIPSEAAEPPKVICSSTDLKMPEQSEMISQFQPLVAAQLVPVKLTEDNYALWIPLMVPVLKNYDMFNMVQGIEQPLTEDRDQKCLYFIKLTLSEAMLSYAAEACSSSRALWLKLEEQGEIEKLRAAGSPVPDGDFVKHVLNGLPSHYVAFANSIRVGNAGADAILMIQEELQDLLVAEETSRRRQICLEVIMFGALLSFGCMFNYLLGYDTGYAKGRP
ncbi:hypothetical protein ACLB2K_067066 [Fragaria x ananassa]